MWTRLLWERVPTRKVRWEGTSRRSGPAFTPGLSCSMHKSPKCQGRGSFAFPFKLHFHPLKKKCLKQLLTDACLLPCMPGQKRVPRHLSIPGQTRTPEQVHVEHSHRQALKLAVAICSVGGTFQQEISSTDYPCRVLLFCPASLSSSSACRQSS